MYADQMKSVALLAYQDKESVSGIEEEVKKLDQQSKAHYSSSGLSSIFNNIYSACKDCASSQR